MYMCCVSSALRVHVAPFTIELMVQTIFSSVPEGEGSTVYIRIPLPNDIFANDSPPPPNLERAEREVGEHWLNFI